MHINALKTQLMHKSVQTNPKKIPKVDTTLLLFYVDTRIFFENISVVIKYKTLIINVLVRTRVCKPTASPRSQGKMCRAGFLQLWIANVLDRTPVCKVRAIVFPLKSRENSQRRICAPLQCKWLFWMTHVQPCTNNLVRFASVILGMLPFVQTGNIDIC